MFLNENRDTLHNISLLISGNLAATIITSIGNIIIINLISIEDYAFIRISLILPIILILIGELGLNYASIHFIARKKKENDIEAIKNITKILLIIKVSVGLLLMILVLIFSEFISYTIYGIYNQKLVTLTFITSIGIFATIISESLISVLIGIEYMKFVSISIVINKISNITISLILVFVGIQIYGPIIGFVFGPSLISVINVIMVYKFIFKKEQQRTHFNWNILKEMVRYGYPLSIVSIISGIQVHIFSYILIIFGFIKEISYYSVAILSSQLIIIITQSLTQTLFPIFSKEDWHIPEEKIKLKNYFQFSIKLSNFLVLPIIILLIIFSEDIFPMIFGLKYEIASPFISLYFVIFTMISFGSISIPAFFFGQKRTKYIFYIEVIKLTSGIIFSIIIINLIGSIGIMLGIIIGATISVIYSNLLLLRKYGYGLLSEFKKNLGIFIIALILGGFVYIIKMLIKEIILINSYIYYFIILLILAFLYIAFYYLLLGLLSLLTEEELNFFSKSFERVPIIGKIICKLFNFEKKILNLRKSKENMK